MAVKNRLKEIRMKEFMMNQREFSSKILEMDYRKYNNYENGTVPSAESMLYIAKKLNRLVEDIFYLED
ncbi:helix-turn-helix transcriptional regulator [Tepidibacter thalassicus]|uniref:DNA-binding transcriptional regulator, XRE-family HTH domain n=1 Tax=Tepidibacter thalassicus DSM 15285 TaxID=1123350 RepID=A0A1M5PVW2_9FIRM|nr:helix-turn-helix domain-containing protein [Tepidibacter thalassicus]SHH05651.1 DNA-binding transcriptional regulator, XRE-family HTH domain [Tepidibacter thalassicus DSM 15285]